MKRSLLALTLLAALPFAASAAEGVSYNYVEAGYAATDVDGSGFDADGWAINGSAAIAPNFHIFGGYSGQEIDDDFNTLNGVDVDQWNVGIGYNHELNSQVDLLTRVAYQKAETDGVTINGVNFGGTDADGWNVEAGVRGAFNPYLEGYALAGYEDFESADGEFYGKLGAQVKLNQSWGVNGEVKFVDGYTAWFVGPRFSF